MIDDREEIIEEETEFCVEVSGTFHVMANSEEEAEQFNQSYQKQQAADIALESLEIQSARRRGMGVADMMFIDLDGAGNSMDPAFALYNDILQGTPLAPNTRPQDIYSSINTYPQLQLS